MTNRYVLNAQGEPVPEPDLLTWAAWFEKPSNRFLAQDDLAGGVKVSTMFLGLDPSFASGGAPVLWETMIFGGKHDRYQERYLSREQAIAGHALAVEMVSKDSEEGQA